MNNYLVIRQQAKDLTRVFDFGDRARTAIREYERCELHGEDCVLLGADSVATLRQTHGSWFLGTVEEVKYLPQHVSLS